MERRRYLAGLAGAAGLLAGCSGRDDSGDATATVTPAPVPEEDPAALVDDAGTNPAAIAAAHVSVLSGGNATVRMEYAATVDREPVDLIRVMVTVDGSATTYRRFETRPLDLGGSFTLFRGYWHDSGEAVTRLVEEGSQSTYHERDDFEPPSPADRFHRDGLDSILSAYAPGATRTPDGYRLKASDPVSPGALPTANVVDPRPEGRLAARLEPSGLVPGLAARGTATARGDPATLSYRVAVTDRGATTVEKPDAPTTLEWYRSLRAASPVENVDTELATGTDEAAGFGEPPGVGGT